MFQMLYFNKQTTFTGRNGTFKCTGLELMYGRDQVGISPITSKGEIGNCVLNIPKGDLPEVIQALQRIQDKI